MATREYSVRLSVVRSFRAGSYDEAVATMNRIATRMERALRARRGFRRATVEGGPPEEF